MSALQILLSGPGLIGRKHAELLARSDNSDLSAIVAPRLPENVAFAAHCNVPLFDSIQSALRSSTFDGAIIASPNEFHCEQAIECLDRGIPLLVEKPLAASLGEADAICRKSNASGVPVLVGHHRTYSSLLPAARDFISSARFGRLVGMQGSALFRKPTCYFHDGPWRTRAGGGPVLINLIHEIGIMHYLCGEIESVWAEASNAQRKFEVEDTVAIGLSFANGALGTFLLSDIAASNQSWEMTSGENPAYPHFLDANCYHFAGTNGSLDFPTMKARYYGADKDASWWTPFEQSKLEVRVTDPLERQLAHFERVIQGLDKAIVPADIGRANMRVIEAIQLASRTKKRVLVEEIG